MESGWESLSCSSRDDCVEGGAEVHKEDPGVGCCCVQVLEEEVKGHVDSVVIKVGLSND